MASEYMGAQRLVQAQLADKSRVELLVGGENALSAGDTVHVTAAASHIHSFDAQGLRLAGAQA